VAKSFACKLVTPERQLLDHATTYASVPAWDGFFGVLPGRAPILARLGTGELMVRVLDEEGQSTERSFFVQKGFVKMAGDDLTVIAEAAAPAEEINETDAQAELKQAEALTIPEDIAGRDKRRDAIDAARTKVRLAQASKNRGI